MYTITQGLRVWLGVRIAVAGSGKVENPEQFKAGLEKALASLDDKLENTPHAFIAVATLDSDLDRLAADIILDWPAPKGGLLEVVLPDERSETAKKVDNPAEFSRLCDKAYNVRVVDQTPRPPLGELLVRHCDVLVYPANSGDSYLYSYAKRDVGRTIVRIDAGGQIAWEPNDDATLESMEQLDEYNGEKIAPEVVASQAEQMFGEMSSLAYQSGIRRGTLEPLRASVLPHMVRAGALAERWQRWHVGAGQVFYYLAALSVATLTIGRVFFPEQRGWIWAEFIEIAIILITVGLSMRGEWLRRWIDYRFLSERLRATVYLFVAGVDPAPAAANPTEMVARWPTPWMATAFASICNCAIPTLSEDDLKPVKKFILSGWIADQQEFYERTAHKIHGRHKWLERLGWLCFGVTFLAAASDAADLFPEHDKLTVCLAIILPALGASMAGFRAYREYRRTAREYRGMSAFLARIHADMVKASDVESFQKLVVEANENMLQEHQGWRRIVSVHEPTDSI